MQVMDLLHRLYQAFDDLTTKHDLFKVETIGEPSLWEPDSCCWHRRAALCKA